MIKNSKETKKIHRLLKNTIINYETLIKWFEGSEEELIKVMKPLNNYFIHHSPKKLFKMRPVTEHAFDAAEKDELYLSRADRFNDPYDCFLFFDSEVLKNTIADYLSDESIKRFLIKTGIRFPNNKKLPKDCIFKLLHTKRTEFLQECCETLPNITKELQTNTFITCLTENIESPVMWAHYANNHKGFAIEYQFRTDMFPPQLMIMPNDNYNWYGWRSILPVYYSSSRLDGTALASWYASCKWFKLLFGEEPRKDDLSHYLPDMLLKAKMCLQKASEWAYEREWRLMIVNSWPNQVGANSANIVYPPSAIYLGDRIEEQNSNRLKELARQKNIPIYKMYINQSCKKYKMDVQMI